MIPELVIFDCDGVLVDSEGPTSIVISKNLNKHGLSTSPGEISSLFTGGTMESVEAEALHRGAILPPDWLSEIYAEIFQRLGEGVATFDGLTDLLDMLDAFEVPQFIASNGPREKMGITLGPSGLWQRFGGEREGRILSRSNFRPKPDPAMILFAMSQTGVAGHNTVMIDDSVSGCRAGLAAGVRTIGFATEGQDADLAHLGAEVANSMADVKRLIFG